MNKILVMTDLHLTPGAERIIGLDPMERAEAALSHAAKAHPDADHLIVTGDLTHHGDTQSYHKLQTILADTPWPVRLLLGNHDKRSAFKAAFPDHPVDPNGFVQSIVDLDQARLILLDSLDEEGAVIGHAGHLCEKRLAWLAREVKEAGDKPCLVFLHHPPFKTGFAGMDDICLLNDAEFQGIVSNTSVAHIFAGHVHRTVTSNVAGIPTTLFKSTCHQMPMLLGADGSEHSVDEPAGYGIVLADEASVVVHFEDVH